MKQCIKREERTCLCGCGNKFICKVNSIKKYIHTHYTKKYPSNKKINIIKKCLNCNKIFEVVPSQNYIKYCSKKCADIIRSKLYSGINNPFYGKHHSEKIKEKISIETKKAMKNPEIIKRISKTWFKKGEHSNLFYEFKKGHKETLLESTKRIANILKSKGLKTKPEKQIENLLNNLFPNKYKYTGMGAYFILTFNPDFVCIEDKKIIEVYGDYWHNLPKVKIKDIKRLEIYNQYNYKTLIIWEHELKDIEKLKNKIRDFNNE